jgi:hypothetical protein
MADNKNDNQSITQMVAQISKNAGVNQSYTASILTVDERDLLDRLRRPVLLKICQAYGIGVDPRETSAIEMRMLIQVRNIDVTKPLPQSPKAAVVAEEDSDASLSMGEVRKACTERGIKWDIKMKKVELLEKLKEHDDLLS